MGAKILLIEDNPHYLEINREALTMHGYQVIEADTIHKGRALFVSEAPNLIILDIMLPDGDGRLLCEELRTGTRRVPILFVSSLKEDGDVLTGFEAGGDAYLSKPYSLEILIKNVKALLKLSDYVPDTVIKGALTLKINYNEAFVNGENLGLSKNTEFSLLNLLVKNENKVLSAEYLYQETWGQSMADSSQALRTAIKRLRNKLKGSGYTISNEYGTGYMFEKGESE